MDTRPTAPTGNGEPQWSSAPAEEHLPVSIPLRRVPGAGTNDLVCISRAIEGTETHFWKRRTIPCTGRNCPACADHCSKRWEGYLYFYNPRKIEVIMLALTPGLARWLNTHVPQHGGFYKMVMNFTRKNKAANGVISVSLRRMWTEALPTEPIPDIRESLKRIWAGGFKHVDQALKNMDIGLADEAIDSR